MCFHLAFPYTRDLLQTRFDAFFLNPGIYEPRYYVPAHSNPQSPVITNADSKQIRFLEWGLIPSWARGKDKAEQLRKGTYNARRETLFEKPAFRSSIKNKRCLVIAGGFFEWREVKGKKYPYYIRLKSREPFAFAGIWDTWRDDKEKHDTFSIITTDANPLMAKIHNTKKRMPAILRREDEKQWLSATATQEDIKEMLQPIDDSTMEAYTISKLVTARDRERNVPEVIAPFEYEELKHEQKAMF